MLKHDFHELDLIFDIETVPCLETAMRVYPQLAILADRGDKTLMEGLYQLMGATKNEPKPFLKFLLHKVVSVAGVARRRVRPSDEHPYGVELAFFALPGSRHEMTEKEIVERFLTRIGEAKPRLVGFASSFFDVPCLAQRALINGCVLPSFAKRPAKPWEGADYFSKDSDFNIDLMKVLGGGSWSPNASMKLTEIAPALRIPGKLGVDGTDVADMYLCDMLADIVAYNECDAATTYLVWLEVLRMNGLVTENAYIHEKEMFRSLMVARAAAGAEHLERFVAEWDRLQGRVETESEVETDSGEMEQPAEVQADVVVEPEAEMTPETDVPNPHPLPVTEIECPF